MLTRLSIASPFDIVRGMKPSAHVPRVRRSAAEARDRILEATGKRLLQEGPSALRLQEIAADVGVSHPTILHHFGSREALVREVVEREVRRMEEELVAAVASVPVDEAAPVEVLRRAMDAFLASGHARLLAYLALEPKSSASGPSAPHLRRLAEVVHARRVERCGPAPFEDTLHTVLAVSLAVVADALLGEGPWHAMGLDDVSRGRFHDWLIARASERIEGGAAPAERSPDVASRAKVRPRRKSRR